MQFRLRTSKRTEEIFASIYAREYLQPFVLVKLSIALALHDGYKIVNNKSEDCNGLDLNRQTITGDNEALFKALIEVNEERHINEEEYFPSVVKQYIDYGAILLEQEYKYGHNFYSHLVDLEKSI